MQRFLATWSFRKGLKTKKNERTTKCKFSLVNRKGHKTRKVLREIISSDEVCGPQLLCVISRQTEQIPMCLLSEAPELLVNLRNPVEN